MHAKNCLSALPLVALALVFPGAGPASAADCMPPGCTLGESADGGVADGAFESNATEAAPVPGAPPGLRVDAAEDLGSAIFNPFAGGRERQEKAPVARLSRSPDGEHAVILTLGAMLALALAAAGCFFFWHRKRRDTDFFSPKK